MSLLKALKQSLTDLPGVRHLAGLRVYNGRIPKGQPLPAVTIRRIGGTSEYALDGEITSGQTVVQVDCWAHTPEERDELAKAVRLFLSGFRGYAGKEPSFVFVNGSTIVRDHDFEEQPIASDDRWTFRSSRDYRITWQQARAPQA